MFAFSRSVCQVTSPRYKPLFHAQAEASSRLPRFFSQTDLPEIAGSCIELSTAESKHATRVLRLGSEALVEVCNGHGQIVCGRLITQSKAAAHVVTTTQIQQVCHKPQSRKTCSVSVTTGT